ncbi:hypothetical protein TEA_026705 [Camellia sinensis var. sinensis]|uniref:CASP-like protein n=1 Tax=Camellia sinensis var. sinensis TaxID=542762 RepID=A0A4V3WJQ9_CAMSN|nr:hypothetical protein TEA_026705 [Camellia sinensis var. sinensis]
MNHRIFQNKDPQLSSRRTAFSYELFSSSSLSLSSSSSSSLQSISLTVTLLMRSPQDREALRNSETPSPRPGIQSHHHHHFHSTVSVQKLRRLNTLIFVFRLAAFCFSVAASVFMLVNPTSASNSPRWYNFDAFRFVLAANTIVAVYSLFEMGASVWEISSGVTLLPEILQVCKGKWRNKRSKEKDEGWKWYLGNFINPNLYTFFEEFSPSILEEEKKNLIVAHPNHEPDLEKVGRMKVNIGEEESIIGGGG